MSTGLLFSGGLDSAVLLADEVARGDVQPLYVSVGLAWERAERAVADRLLAAPPLDLIASSSARSNTTRFRTRRPIFAPPWHARCPSAWRTICGSMRRLPEPAKRTSFERVSRSV